MLIRRGREREEGNKEKKSVGKGKEEREEIW